MAFFFVSFELRFIFLVMEETIILMYMPRKNAGRIKFHIPYEMTEERLAFKQLNGSFYHPTQRLWSLPNTVEHKKQVVALFGKKLQEMSTNAPPEMPVPVVTEAIHQELDRHYQKMKLKHYSDSTI